MKDRYLIALAGFMGGIGPSLAELASLAKENNLPHFSFYVGMVITGILGLTVVLIAKEKVPWKAFTQGMGAPALFSTTVTAVTSAIPQAAAAGALLFSPVGVAYADPFNDSINQDKVAIADSSIKIPDSVTIIIDGQPAIKNAPGDTISIEKKGYTTQYVVPNRDTVKIKTDLYDPVIRRSLIQGLLPMQKNLTEQFEPKLNIKELQ
jgi:hypothetical protein